MGLMQGKAGQPEPNQPKSNKPQTVRAAPKKETGGRGRWWPRPRLQWKKRAKHTYERENPIIRVFG